MHQLRLKQLSPLQVVYRSADGTLGIENVKSILTILITFLVDLLAIIKSGNYVRLFELIFGLIRFGNVIVVAKEAWNELKDVSLEESQELNAHFAREFDIEDDAVEMLVEQAISTIPKIYQLALNGLELIGNARELYTEIRVIFGGGSELAELSGRLNKAA